MSAADEPGRLPSRRGATAASHLRPSIHFTGWRASEASHRGPSRTCAGAHFAREVLGEESVLTELLDAKLDEAQARKPLSPQNTMTEMFAKSAERCAV